MKILLLAAGHGKRMRPLTDHTPKPLLKVGGKPLIVWHIERLVRAGFFEMVINHAHLGAQIENCLGDGSRFGAHIHYSREASALETAGGIANALPLLFPGRDKEGQGKGGSDKEEMDVVQEPFAVINSDIFCDYDFTLLPERAFALLANGDSAHLVLVNNPPHHPNGDFALANGRVTQPVSSVSPSATLTFSGIGIYQAGMFKAIARGSRAPLAPLLYAQIAAGKISGEHHQGLWVDVGTPQRLAELDSQVGSLHNVP